MPPHFRMEPARKKMRADMHGPLNADAANVRFHNLPQNIARPARNEEINLSERRPLHSLTGGEEKASGWSVGDVPAGSNMNIGGAEQMQQDLGQVNRVQTIRVAEALAPLPKHGVQVNALDVVQSPPDPVQQTAPKSLQFNPGYLRFAKVKPRQYFLNEADKMGLLRTDTDTAYVQEAVRIRGRELYVADHISKEVDSAPPTTAATAVGAEEIQDEITRDSRGRFIRRPTNTMYNNVIAGPRPAPTLENTIPGSVANTYIDRADSPAVNCLEKLVVRNPMGTVLLLDKGTFSPQFRSLSNYPAVVRAQLRPSGPVRV